MANKKEKEVKGEERLENVETALSKTELWIEEHQKLIYGIIAAIIVIAGIIWGLKALNDRKDRNASKEIFTAQKYFEKESYEAALTGDVICQNMDFCGTMKGNFYVKDTLNLKAGCIVDGDLHIKRLQVELGARFNGNCHMLEEAEFEKITGTVPAKETTKQ